MTTEERFQKIENVLTTITGLQARHDESIRQHDEAVKRIDAQLEKQHSGIQDLIRVSRALVDSHIETAGIISALGKRVDQIAENVNRFLSGFQTRNGHTH